MFKKLKKMIKCHRYGHKWHAALMNDYIDGKRYFVELKRCSICGKQTKRVWLHKKYAGK